MEKYSTKENETYREHAEKAVHKVEEHGQQARHNPGFLYSWKNLISAF